MPSSQNCKTGIFLAGFLVAATLLSAAPGPFLQVGSETRGIVLKDLGDRDVTFPVPGRWNVVFYWSLFCHTCIEEIPIIADEISKFQGKNVSAFFVTLDTARMKKGVENFLKKRRLEIPVLLEEIASESYKSADIWGVKTTPSAFLISPNGKVVFSQEGPFDVEGMLKILRDGLASEVGATGTTSCP